MLEAGNESCCKILRAGRNPSLDFVDGKPLHAFNLAAREIYRTIVIHPVEANPFETRARARRDAGEVRDQIGGSGEAQLLGDFAHGGGVVVFATFQMSRSA